MAKQAGANPKKVLGVIPTVVLDEALWFGSSAGDVAEQAAAKSLAATAGTVIGAKPFPESARRLAELSTHDSTTLQQYVQVLEQDPALSAKLLRIVNSAGFGLRQKCTSLRHAVSIVGSKRLHQLATTAAVLDLYDSDSDVAVKILEHSTVMGAFCRYLGAHLSLPAEDLFTIGALHDIGKLMMLETFGERYRKLFEEAQDQVDVLFSLEREEYGFDHGVLAAHVLKAWNIPDPIPKIVAWHHEVTRAYDSSTFHSSLVQVVRLADVLVYAIARGNTQSDLPQIARHEAASYLDISEAQLGAMWEELKQLYASTLDVKQADPSTEATQEDSTTQLKTSSARKPLPVNVPKAICCIECGAPSFGTTCPSCKGHICPDHSLGPAGWCGLCVRDYANFESTTRFILSIPRALGVSALLLIALTGYGWLDSGRSGLLRGIITATLITILLTLIAVVGKRSYLRTKFLRSRPNRSS